jgi:hypothetical protein
MNRRFLIEKPPCGGFPKFLRIVYEAAAIAEAFCFLRRESRQSRPRPPANSGSAAGSGVVAIISFAPGKIFAEKQQTPETSGPVLSKPQSKSRSSI